VNHKETIKLRQEERAQTLTTLNEVVQREKQKMEVLHQAELEQKERQHQNNLE